MSFQGYPVRMGVIATTGADGKSWYGVNFVGYGDAPGLSSKEYQPSFGFAARPLDADTDGIGCNGFYSNQGGFAWLGHDPRLNAKCPPITKGSSAQWNANGDFFLLDHTARTATLNVNVTDSSAHIITIGKSSSGKQIIDLLHANGSHFTLGEDDTVWRGSGNAFLQIKGDNILANGTFKAGSGDFGGGAGMPVVNATAFQAVLAALATALNAATPITPYEIALQAALLAVVSAFPACATTKLTAI